MDKQEALLKLASALTLVNDVADNFEDKIGEMPGKYYAFIGDLVTKCEPIIPVALRHVQDRLSLAIRLIDADNLTEYTKIVVEKVKEEQNRRRT